MKASDSAALRELLAKATPGEWRFDGDWHRLPTILGGQGGRVAIIEKWGAGRDGHTSAQAADADLIVALRNAAPALLDRLETQDKRIAEMREALVECADSLEAEVNARRDTELPRRIERDLEPVTRARALTQDTADG